MALRQERGERERERDREREKETERERECLYIPDRDAGISAEGFSFRALSIGFITVGAR